MITSPASEIWGTGRARVARGGRGRWRGVLATRASGRPAVFARLAWAPCPARSTAGVARGNPDCRACVPSPSALCVRCPHRRAEPGWGNRIARVLGRWRRAEGGTPGCPSWGEADRGESTERLPPPSRPKGALPLVVELGEPHPSSVGAAERPAAGRPVYRLESAPPAGAAAPGPSGAAGGTGLAERPCGT